MESRIETNRTILLARQPIVDTALKVVAYELLYRPEAQTSVSLTGDHATRKVLLNSLAEMSFDSLIGDSLAFINMTRQTLLEIEHLGIPADRVVLEILEDIELNSELQTKIEELKAQGFRFALDDFTLAGIHTENVPLAEIVKVDINGMSDNQIIRHANELSKYGVKLLAEKVETWREFELCKDAGYELFQGYFFAKPQLVHGAQVVQLRSSVVALIDKLQDPESTATELERLIQQDPALTYKLFKYANAASYSKGKEFSRIKEVVVLLGLDKLKQIVTLFALSSMNEKPIILTEVVLRRAYLCSLVAKQARNESAGDYFTLGLFSMLDAYLDQPIDQLIDQLPLTDEIKSAILNGEGAMGETLRLAETLETIDLYRLENASPDLKYNLGMLQEAALLAREVVETLN